MLTRPPGATHHKATPAVADRLQSQIASLYRFGSSVHRMILCISFEPRSDLNATLIHVIRSETEPGFFALWPWRSAPPPPPTHSFCCCFVAVYQQSARPHIAWPAVRKMRWASLSRPASVGTGEMWRSRLHTRYLATKWIGMRQKLNITFAEKYCASYRVYLKYLGKIQMWIPPTKTRTFTSLPVRKHAVSEVQPACPPILNYWQFYLWGQSKTLV
jgi:hypothetical protein